METTFKNENRGIICNIGKSAKNPSGIIWFFYITAYSCVFIQHSVYQFIPDTLFWLFGRFFPYPFVQILSLFHWFSCLTNEMFSSKKYLLLYWFLLQKSILLDLRNVVCIWLLLESLGLFKIINQVSRETIV